MDDLRDKLSGQRNWLEQILLKIPGFQGYLEKENRREADHLLRQHLAGRLAEAKRRLNDRILMLTNTGRMCWLQRLNPASSLLEKLEGRVRFARHGYSGFFDAAKVGAGRAGPALRLRRVPAAGGGRTGGPDRRRWRRVPAARWPSPWRWRPCRPACGRWTPAWTSATRRWKA